LYKGGFLGDHWSDGSMSCTFYRLKVLSSLPKGQEGAAYRQRTFIAKSACQGPLCHSASLWGEPCVTTTPACKQKIAKKPIIISVLDNLNNCQINLSHGTQIESYRSGKLYHSLFALCKHQSNRSILVHAWCYS
jgi:hypothetical protein